MGAATKNGVANGKKRMTNAVVGLVLLLCVRLIASTVNPYLVRLQVPKFPMVKQVGLPSSESSCEDYAKKKDANGKFLYKLEIENGGTTVCGGSANVLAAEGQPAIAAGITCDYRACQAGANCIGSGKEAKCTECLALTEDNKLGLKPSPAVCSQLTPSVSDIPNSPIIRCGYTDDADLISGVVTSASAAITGGTCAQISIVCPFIKTCSDYDTVPVRSDPQYQPLEDIQDTYLGVKRGNFSLESICKENPCGVKVSTGFSKKDPSQGVCVYTTGVAGLADDCKNNF